MFRTWRALRILTWKSASCHNALHFLTPQLPKTAPELRCFLHFDFEMCFAPQRSGHFQQLNFQEWSEHVVLCAFWLGNVLRATTACTFQHRNFQNFFESLFFLTFWLPNLLCTTAASIFHFSSGQMAPHPPLQRAYFSTLRSPKTLERQSVPRLLYLFRAPASSFFWLFLFSDLLSSCSLFADSSHLSSSSVHIVGTLTSKLPSRDIWVYIHKYMYM